MQLYCNREKETSRLKELTIRAKSQYVVRASNHGGKRQVKQLSPALNEAIIVAYRAGDRVTKIARTLGVTEGTVHHRLNVAGITRRPTSLSSEQVEEARELRASGLTYKKIAERYSVAEATIRNKLGVR